MRCATTAFCCGWLLLGQSLFAADLTKIDRTIQKSPELKSGAPEYCLLVFGPDAAKRVWLLHDGDVLYVDRNGNGDLTEPGERVEVDPRESKPAEGVWSFSAGAIPDGPVVHKDLHVSWFKVDHLLNNEAFKAILSKIAMPRACRVSIDVAMPGKQGGGLEGRVEQSASLIDQHGLLRFGRDPSIAPVIHFGGPWELQLTQTERWRAGRSHEVDLVFGTPGLGPGTMSCVAFQGVVPPEVHVRLKAKFPNAEVGGEPIEETYELTRRCCGVNLYGDVRVPDNVGVGKATFELSAPSWSGGSLASTTHEATILPALPGPKHEPVSPRLASKLEHSQTSGVIANIQYSPDGKRLIASNYPGGVIHIWDLASGERTLTIESGEGHRSSMSHFNILPGWRTALVPRMSRGVFTKVERDGKSLNHVVYDDLVYLVDLTTGERLRVFQDSPPRGLVITSLFPDGTHFFTQEEVPGDFDNSRPRALSVWEVATGQHRQFAKGSASVGAYSRDGKRAAVSMPHTDNDRMYFTSAIKVLSLPDLTEAASIPVDHPRAYVHVSEFAADGQSLIGTVTSYPKADYYQEYDSALKIWEVATGKELLTIPASKGSSFAGITPSPDGRTLFASTTQIKSYRSKMYRIDLNTLEVRDVLEADAMLRSSVFHPSGKWLAVVRQPVPTSLNPRDDSVDNLPQPSILCIDATSGQVLETLPAPAAYMSSLAFSPDGRTLATSGKGAVLLWDFSTPPGAKSNDGKPIDLVGQPLVLDGELAGGGTFDAAAHQGRVVLVDFWATWCAPCVAEIPQLRATYEKYHDQGLDIVAVSLDEDRRVLTDFVRDRELPWPVIAPPADATGYRHPLAARCGVDILPRSFLVDRSGKVVAVDVKGDALHAQIERLLSETPPAAPAGPAAPVAPQAK